MKPLSSKAEKRVSYLVLLLPALLIYLFVMAYPVINSFYLSFTKYNVYQNTSQWIGLDNYLKMFSAPLFWRALKNNMIIMGLSIFGQIPLGFLLAYSLFRGVVKKTAFFQSMIFLPAVVSTIVIGVLWEKLFAPHGPILGILSALGFHLESFGFMNNPHLALIPVLIVMLWMYTGTFLIIFIANLQKISPSILEAARIDGANDGQIMRIIILPAMMTCIVTTVILAISGSLKSFDLVWAMTQGGPANYTSVLSIFMYQQSFQLYDYSYGSAISSFMVVLSFLLLGLTTLVQKLFAKWEE